MPSSSRSSSTIVADIIWIIAALGAINWGLIGFFERNLVTFLLGEGAIAHASMASRVVYAIVGLSGLAGLVFLPIMRISSTTRTAGATSA